MLDIHLKRTQGAFTVDAAFQAPEAGVTALFGNSGAGKTSIINMVSGLVRPDAGHIRVNGHTLFDAEKKIHVRPERRRFGYVFQDGRLFPHLSVRSNLTYGMKLVPPDQRYIHFDSVVDLLGIGHLLDRHPANLSGGEKQRVAIGRSLLTSPVLLLMDEPLASLDTARKCEVMPFIARLPQEFSIPILYVSHSVNEILSLADNLVCLRNGSVVAAGPVETVTSRFDFQHMIPSSAGFDAGVVIATVVDGHDREAGLTRLKFSGGMFHIPRTDLSPGVPVRVRIRPRDVAISLGRPEQTSVQNIFPGTVDTVVENNGSLVDVRLNIGCPLLSLISPRAKTDLNLQPGRKVYAMIKSVSISGGAAESMTCDTP